MSDAPVTPTAPVEPAAPAAPTAPVPAAPAAPAAPKPVEGEKPAVTFTPEQQAAINAIVAERVAATKQSSAKTLEERVAEIEKVAADQVAAAETAAISAIVAKAAAGSHNPAAVEKLLDLTGLTAADGPAIEAKVAEFLTENPYLVKQAGPVGGPTLAPAPGVGSTAPAGVRLLTAAEMEKLTPQELANSDTMALYLKSMAAIQGRG